MNNASIMVPKSSEISMYGGGWGRLLRCTGTYSVISPMHIDHVAAASLLVEAVNVLEAIQSQTQSPYFGPFFPPTKTRVKHHNERYESRQRSCGGRERWFGTALYRIRNKNYM